MDKSLKELNSAQNIAVSSPAEVLQVLAPPGSGKTKTLTARIAHLILHQGYRPWNIIVCTFTIKAAREMKERVKTLIGDQLEKKLILGTFHSVARRYLVSYGHYIGIPNDFGIVDTSDTTAIIKRIIKRNKLEAEASKIRSRISRVKARSNNLGKQSSEEKQEFDLIFAEYEEALKASNTLDYDDLLLRCADLLRERPDCVANVESILIDEFQDTNHVQYELMSLFAQKNGRITIVGDPDQSIYSFRSADVENVARMRKRYPHTQVVHLEENYRSAGSILHSALELIEQDKARPTKKLLSTHSVGVRPVLRRLPHPKAEASWIVEEIKRSMLLTSGLLTYGDYAVLVRSSSQSQALELAFGKAGLPYRMVGGNKFFDRWEVKILLSYLRVIGSPNHSDAIMNIINIPSRGISDAFMKDLVEEGRRRNVCLWRLIMDIAQGRAPVQTQVRAQTRKGLEAFAGIILSARKKLDAAEMHAPVGDLLAYLLQRLAWDSYLKKKSPEDFETRWENVQELCVQAAHFGNTSTEQDEDLNELLPLVHGLDQYNPTGGAATLACFLANVALATDANVAEATQSTGPVTISTIHAAKGLEWPVVFIPSVYEGSIPHSRAEDHDEERRLLYVAMTRAQTLLYLSSPLRSSITDNSNTLTMSPFLTSSTLTSLFSSKGPSIGFNVIQDMSHVLKRPCPSRSHINDVFTEAYKVEDDHWPLDGSDLGLERNGALYGKATSFHSTGRARYDDAANLASFGSTTTMPSRKYEQDIASMQTPIFMSANAHMAQLTEQKISSTPLSEKRKANDLKHPNRNKKARAKTLPVQGSITGFLEKVHVDSAPPPDIQSNLTISGGQLRSRPIVVDPATYQRNDKGGTGRSQLSANVSDTRDLACSSHVKNELGDGISYASSESLNSVANAQAMPRKMGVIGRNRDESNRSGQADNSERSKLTSFHTTSMDILRNRVEGLPTRTLGVRRSLKGWSSTRWTSPIQAPARASHQSANK